MPGPYSTDQLPEGYSLHARKTAADPDFNQLLIVADNRLDSPEPSHRMMTIIEGVDQADWGDELRARLQTVSDLQSKNLARPMDFGESDTSGQLWFVSDYYGDSLQSHFEQTPDIGLPPDVAWHVFESILGGMCDLHDAGLAHENLHPGNVIYSLPESGQLDSTTEIRVVGATTGPRPRWRNRRRPDDQRVFVGTVRDDQRIPSAEQRDLYALGIIGCMLLLGPESVRRAGEAAVRDKCTVWSVLRSELKGTVSISRMSLKNNRWAVLERLLSREPARQLAHALSAREKIPTSYRQNRRMLKGVVAAVLVVACLLGALRDRAVTLQKHEAIVEAREKDNTLLTQKIAGLEQRLNAATSGATAANGDPELPGPDDRETAEPKQSAADFWKKYGPGTSGRVTSRELTFAVAKAGKAAPDHLKSYFGRKTKSDLIRIQSLEPEPWYEDWKPGVPRDKKLRELWDAVVFQPWAREKREKLMHRMGGLDQATELWVKWARNEKMDTARIEKKIRELPEETHEEEKRILDSWRFQLSQVKSWKVVMEEATSQLGEDYRTLRQLTFYNIDGFDEAISETWKHEWETHEKHTYKKEKATIPVKWKLGFPIQVLLEKRPEGTTEFMASNMLQVNVEGALSLWRLHYIGGVRDDKVELVFHLEHCPGPPQKKKWKTQGQRDKEMQGELKGALGNELGLQIDLLRGGQK